VQLHVQAQLEQRLLRAARVLAHVARQRALELAEKRLAEETVAFHLVVFHRRRRVQSAY
jgi:hypothetical protein